MDEIKEFLQLMDQAAEDARAYNSDATGPKCRRKAVRCQVRTLRWELLAEATNGPLNGKVCSNVVGGCGCMHAEPKAMISFARDYLTEDIEEGILIFCTYAPCSNCARIILHTMQSLPGVKVHGIYCLHRTPHDPMGLTLLEEVFPVTVFDKV